MMWFSTAWLTTPTKALTIRANVLVATAICAGNPSTKVIIGTWMMPPPMPRIEDRKPTMNEQTTPNLMLRSPLGSKSSSVLRPFLALARKIITAARHMSAMPKKSENDGPENHSEI